jgi:hypothetical protein
MSEPLIFVTTATLEEDASEAFEEGSTALVALAEASDNSLVAYHFHLSEDGSTVANVQVHADAESMDAYLLLAQKQIAQTVELTTITSIDVFGRPGPVLQQALQHNTERGVPVRIMPVHLGGITRHPAV